MILPRVFAIVGLLCCAASGESTTIDIGSRRELFVDHYLIGALHNATLKLHQPVQAETAITRDRPWEGYFAFGYMTVLKDNNSYRLYYRSYPGGESLDGESREMTCCAESADGIHWTKPEFGLFDFCGTKKNNIVLANMPPYTHNLAPFLDARPGTPAAERYKAMGGTFPGGLCAFVSADGIRWKKLQERPVLVIDKVGLDSQNVAFWSDSEKCYVCYFRTLPEGVRAIARATSPDFVHWSKPVQMTLGDAGTKPPENLYTNQTQPYFRAPHIYIATAARFMQGRRVLTDAQVAQLGIGKDCRWLQDDCSDAVLMSTRGGDHYDRTFMDAWITPGAGLRNWVSRSNYAGWGIVPTGPAEMSLYVGRHNAQKSAHVVRYTLRTDSFVSVRADYHGGEMVTRPFVFSGKSLEINYSTSAAGYVCVEVQDITGKPLPGLCWNECPEIIGDQIERTVCWKQGSDLAQLAGRPIRLRFVMKEADLYSIRFH